MICATMDPLVGWLDIPLDFVQQEEQWAGLSAKVPCEARCAGFICEKVLEVAIYDGL